MPTGDAKDTQLLPDGPDMADKAVFQVIVLVSVLVLSFLSCLLAYRGWGASSPFPVIVEVVALLECIFSCGLVW